MTSQILPKSIEKLPPHSSWCILFDTNYMNINRMIIGFYEQMGRPITYAIFHFIYYFSASTCTIKNNMCTRYLRVGQYNNKKVAGSYKISHFVFMT